MAFDGVVIAGLVHEFKEKILGGRILKISQPEKDELIITIKNYDQYRLFLSADAGLPLAYLTEENKEAPLQSPTFCMLLRKHLTNAKLIEIVQPNFERAISFGFEHYDEMGDLRKLRLIIEIMGKHSNIILVDDEDRIIDSIKRVPASVSSVREVLPGREYFIPTTQDKCNPLDVSQEMFINEILNSQLPVSKVIYSRLTGISPLLSNEIVFRSGIDADMPASDIVPDYKLHLYKVFERFIEDIRQENFSPIMIIQDGKASEFSVTALSCRLTAKGAEAVPFESVSTLLRRFYEDRNTTARIRQRAYDLNRIVSNALSRVTKKYELQLKQMEDTAKRDTYKLYGDLLTTYAYSVVSGESSVTLNNYLDDSRVTIPLDPDLGPIDNAKAYYAKYTKLKRTYEALSKLVLESAEELEHLKSINVALDIALHEEDLLAIREELQNFGYMKKHYTGKGASQSGNAGKKSGRRICKPMVYVTEDGFTVYVGKNNYQNDELSFKLAQGNDWWFHAKKAPGSHVILKADGREIPDNVFILAAQLAAYYSSNRNSDKVEVDYLEKRNLKKPAGAKPGFVVYYTNYSMMVTPQITGVTVKNEIVNN